MAAAYREANSPTQRATGVGIAIALHLALVYGLVLMLGHIRAPVIFDPIKAVILDEVKVDQAEPPPPPPSLDQPPPEYIPPPDFTIDSPAASTTAITNVTTGARVNPKGRSTNIPPEYPPSSQRNREEGVVVLQLLIGADGRVKDAKIDKGSGFPALDEAALNGIKNWRFSPATVDGKPIETPWKVNWRWKCKEASGKDNCGS